MKTFKLEGTLREGLGKKATKALRSSELVPCVLYGGKENVHFQVKVADLRNLIYTPNVYIVELTIGGKKTNAVMKEIQFHPVKDNILHIDFFEIVDNKPVAIEVPVKLEGLSVGVRAGGKLTLDTRKLKVKGQYDKIPDTLVINVETLELGKTIQVKSLSFDGVELLNAPNTVVASCRLTRAARGNAAAEAANK